MGDYTADVVVVGSGAGGGTAAAHLSGLGLRVLLLERGDWFRPEDFPTRHTDWERRGSPFSRVLYSTPGGDPTVAYHRGAAIPEGRGTYCSGPGPGSQSRFRARDPFVYHRVHGVGGSTLHYEGEAHRFSANGFSPGSSAGYGVDWPITYEELAPWYELAEQQLGVAGSPGNPFKANRGLYPTPAHPFSPKGEWIRSGAGKLGWQLLPNSLALPSRPWGQSPGCRHSGVCSLGCPFGAKASVDRALLKPALEQGRIQLLTGARVMELETNSRGQLRQIVFHHEGKLRSASASQYILSAGAIETPRILLASAGGAHGQGIGNDSDQVGRYLMETVFVTYLVDSGQSLEPWKGPPLEARVWDFSHPRPDSGLNGFTLSLGGANDVYPGPRAHAAAIRGIGRAHKSAVRSHMQRMITLQGVSDHEPAADNRIVLSAQADELGMPKVQILSDYSNRDLATIAAMRTRLEELAEASGARAVGRFYSSYSNPSATHVGGTCRMGSERDASVTDSYGRVWGVDNLRILDASVLPGQGLGDSPSLTIQALALRSAAQLAAGS